VASLTIRNIPEDAKQRFRQIAAAHGRSMEEHMRKLLLAATSDVAAGSGVREETSPFDSQGQPAASENRDGDGDDWVYELIHIANGAGEGVFDREPQPLREFDL
jgi:hypothetical protein